MVDMYANSGVRPRGDSSVGNGSAFGNESRLAFENDATPLTGSFDPCDLTPPPFLERFQGGHGQYSRLHPRCFHCTRHGLKALAGVPSFTPDRIGQVQKL
jgi:hypothetical protein